MRKTILLDNDKLLIDVHYLPEDDAAVDVEVQI